MAEVTTKFNQLLHSVEIYIETGNGQKYNVNPNSIVNFSIEDTLSNWVTQGTLSFFYNPDIDGNTIYDSRTGNDVKATDGLTNSDETASLNFTCDGNDNVFIHIVPKTENTNSASVGGVSTPEFNIPEDSVFWSITHKMAIYDMEDIDLPPGAQNAASSTLKCYKLYFWDYWYQKLLTNVIEYSTGESSNANPQSDIEKGYEHPGTIPTGIAMKEILEKGLEDELKIGEGEDWEDGATNIFYTAPAQATAYDNLTYIYEQHISNKSSGDIHDQSILLKEKGPNFKDTGYLTLRPISHFFEKAGNSEKSPGEYQIEHFFLQSYTDSDTEGSRPTKNFKAPIAENSSNIEVDIKTLKYHQITNYRFVDVASITNSREFLSRPVYSVNFKTRELLVEFQANKVDAAKKFIADNYISQLYKGGGSPEDLFLINVDKNKQSKNIRPVFSLFRDESKGRQAVGAQKILYTGLYHNACINFRTLGLTYREPGRFIAIDKTEGVESGDFQNKFFGQWFVINVKHIFESEMYYNDITAVKIHRFEPLS
jgi:hypothetical protein